MTEDLVVEILKGKHSRPVPNGTKEIFEELLENSGFKKGSFKILLGRQIRGACEAKKIMVHNLDEQTGMIMIKAQIDGRKDQRFETFLNLPYQFKQKSEVFLKALRAGEELTNNPPQVEECSEKNNFEISKKPEVEKTIISQRSPRGIGFEHFIADEESIYLFWLEIKKFFENDEKKVSRKELTDKFLINYGHFSSSYRFISKLIQLEIFAEIEASKGNKKDLSIGEKLQAVIVKAEKGEVQKQQSSKKFASDCIKKISRLESMVKEKRDIDNLLEEKERRVRELKKEEELLGLEIEDLKKWITPAMQEAEEKLEALKKILG